MMGIKTNIKTTSVKIIEDLYNDFRHASLDEDINLQKLVNRCVMLYVNDKQFRKKYYFCLMIVECIPV